MADIEIPSGEWIDSHGVLTASFEDVLRQLEGAFSQGPETVAVSQETLDEIARLDAEIDNVIASISGRENYRFYDSGLKSGDDMEVNHGLGTTRVFYTLHKTGEGAVESVNIVDGNSLRITINTSTTFSNIRVYTFDEV